MSTEYIIQTNAHRHAKMIKAANDNNERLRRMYGIRTKEGWDIHVAYWNARRRLWICINNKNGCITEDGPYRMSLKRAQEKAINMASIDDKMYGGKHEYQIWLNYNWHELHHGIDCVECTIDSNEPILPKPNTLPPKSMLTSP